MPNLQLTLTAAIISASLGFGGAWHLQDLRADSKEKVYVEQKLADAQEATRMEEKRITNTVTAVNIARTREIQLVANVAAGRIGLSGLQQSTNRALQASAADLATCTVTAATLGELFNSSAREYQNMADTAQRHVIDIERDRSIAWPQK